MTKQERTIATALRNAVSKREPPLKIRGTLQDYFTVYDDHKRGDGDYRRL